MYNENEVSYIFGGGGKMSSFGNFVKKLRNGAGLSQEKLADKMFQTMNWYENIAEMMMEVDPMSGRRFYSMIRSIRLWKLFVLI